MLDMPCLHAAFSKHSLPFVSQFCQWLFGNIFSDGVLLNRTVHSFIFFLSPSLSLPLPLSLSLSLSLPLSLPLPLSPSCFSLLRFFRLFLLQWPHLTLRSTRVPFCSQCALVITSTWPAATWSTRRRPRPHSPRCSMSSSPEWKTRQWV